MVAPAEVAPTTQNQNTGLIRTDDRIMQLATSGAESLKFIIEMGKVIARPLGLKNDNEGATVLLAAICDGVSPVQVVREYYIMEGGLRMKADVMLGKFNAAGGKHEWVKDGRDGQAVLQLTIDGKTITSVYSIDDAKQAKLIKSGGGWEKNPANMLRARATSEGIRMIRPGIIAGIYCPEDFSENDIPPAEPAKTRQTRTTKTTSAADPDVIDAEVEPAGTGAAVAATTANDVPFDGGTAGADSSTATYAERDKVYMEIEFVLTEIGKTKADIEENMRKKNPAMTTIDDLPLPSAQKLLEQLRAAAAKKRESQAA